ncbi:hypothetical protein [Streptomyces sp. NL15-2K]|uniref:hypothetical protein n=1 Tax=Streptomyces sp. NL15-2K TaxID=376149 RepID=UPI000F55C9B8|nr:MULTISPECIES: hypothetical protein [Actinomycetes]WKX09087.1 hypothetical protein Q4V64_16940 [Kutzneria buriramensis]
MSRKLLLNPRFDDDMQFKRVDGPPTYGRKTDGQVAYLSIAERMGAIIGHVWANDRDGAAGWVVPPGLSPSAVNVGVSWLQALHSGKARGLAPTALLAELARGTNDNKLSHAVPGPLTGAPTLAALRERASGG